MPRFPIAPEVFAASEIMGNKSSFLASASYSLIAPYISPCPYRSVIMSFLNRAYVIV